MKGVGTELLLVQYSTDMYGTDVSLSIQAVLRHNFVYPILDEMMKSWLHSVKIWKCQSANQNLEQHASHAT